MQVVNVAAPVHAAMMGVIRPVVPIKMLSAVAVVHAVHPVRRAMLVIANKLMAICLLNGYYKLKVNGFRRHCLIQSYIYIYIYVCCSTKSHKCFFFFSACLFLKKIVHIQVSNFVSKTKAVLKLKQNLETEL